MVMVSVEQYLWKCVPKPLAFGANVIACVDVSYREQQAQAACVVLTRWTDAVPLQTHVACVEYIHPYESGNFDRRELPCLLAVLQLLAAKPDVIVIDGYVWLSALRAPGLGAHLYYALGRACAVVGVAKTAFAGVCGSPLVAQVMRGTSAKPLYVTSAGIELERAAQAVQAMHGAHRIPTALRLADRLARGYCDR